MVTKESRFYLLDRGSVERRVPASIGVVEVWLCSDPACQATHDDPWHMKCYREVCEVNDPRDAERVLRALQALPSKEAVL